MTGIPIDPHEGRVIPSDLALLYYGRVGQDVKRAHAEFTCPKSALSCGRTHLRPT
jgi:hypothetical protein